MKIGLVGAGRIGSAMIKGLLKAGIDPQQIVVKGGRHQTAAKLIAQYQLVAAQSVSELLDCAVILLAIPAPAVPALIQELSQEYEGMIVSVSGGDLTQINQSLTGAAGFAKAVPNTAVEIAQGIIAVSFQEQETKAHQELVTDLFNKLGQVYVVPEKQLSIYGTIAGCTPALMAVMMDALSDAGVYYGMKREDSHQIILQMLQGTVQLVQNQQLDFEALKDYSATPGGSTIRGVAALEENGFRGALIKAIKACEEG